MTRLRPKRISSKAPTNQWRASIWKYSLKYLFLISELYFSVSWCFLLVIFSEDWIFGVILYSTVEHRIWISITGNKEVQRTVTVLQSHRMRVYSSKSQILLILNLKDKEFYLNHKGCSKNMKYFKSFFIQSSPQEMRDASISMAS